MSQGSEAAEQMTREAIQISKAAVKLAALGAKNLAALCLALANENQKLAGKTNMKKLLKSGKELRNVEVYQGVGMDSLRKGAGHFESTSIWDGNVAFAGHNRGVNNNFGKIHTLETGDAIKLTTKLGTRTYTVYSVRKVSVNDVSVLDSTGENIVTLVTCVMNQPDYRWCVQARQVTT